MLYLRQDHWQQMGDLFESFASWFFRGVSKKRKLDYSCCVRLVVSWFSHTHVLVTSLPYVIEMRWMNWAWSDIAAEEWCWHTWISLKSFWITTPRAVKELKVRYCRKRKIPCRCLGVIFYYYRWRRRRQTVQSFMQSIPSINQSINQSTRVTFQTLGPRAQHGVANDGTMRGMKEPRRISP